MTDTSAPGREANTADVRTTAPDKIAAAAHVYSPPTTPADKPAEGPTSSRGQKKQLFDFDSEDSDDMFSYPPASTNVKPRVAKPVADIFGSDDDDDDDDFLASFLSKK